LKTTLRKSMIYKTGVEYGDYTVNHVLGCSHGCKYPCYAYMLARRFGRVKTYEEWCSPVIASNALELVKQELPKLINKIKSVHLCFTTDPFMYGYEEVSNLSQDIMREINKFGIPCTALTKGVFPPSLVESSKLNSYGITLISLNESYREKYEPGSAKYSERISSLRNLHENGYRTWVSIEPYPTPNIINQDLSSILDAIKFVDRIIFGRLNYNSKVTEYKTFQTFYNSLVDEVIAFCSKYKIEYHIKDGTFKK
jgi:DNA repair photolyase